ncbi:Hypothetical predicted protein, partial [Pelobates cultripes]
HTHGITPSRELAEEPTNFHSNTAEPMAHKNRCDFRSVSMVSIMLTYNSPTHYVAVTIRINHTDLCQHSFNTPSGYNILT